MSREAALPGGVLVYGTLMIDVVVPFPDDYEPGGNYVVGGTSCYGGGGGNVAFYIAMLGGSVAVAGGLGVDPLGVAYRARLEGLGVKLFLAEEGGTGVVVALLHHGGKERGFLANPGANDNASIEVFRRAMDAFDPRVVVIHGYLLGSPQTRKAALEAARMAAGRGVPVVFDPGYHNMGSAELEAAREIAEVSSVIAPNELEACALAGSGDPGDAASRLSRWGPMVFLKRGPRGGELYSGGELIAREPAVSARVSSTVGAGDAFTAAVAYALDAGIPPREALRLAVRLSGYSTECTCPQCHEAVRKALSG